MDIDLTVFFIILAGIIGLAVGSFLNVLIYRIPKEESIVFPGSHCMSCGRNLRWYELIPVLSWAVQRGRCRGCGVKISGRYALVELLTAALFTTVFLVNGLSPETPLYMAFIAVLIAVFFIDIDHMIIPNGLVIAGLILAAGAFILNIFAPLPIYEGAAWWTPILGVLPGAGGLFVVGMLASRYYMAADKRKARREAEKEGGKEYNPVIEEEVVEAIGLGDVKILIPIGIILGWKYCLLGLLIAVVTAGLTAIILMAAKLRKRRDEIPFGPFIVLGATIALLFGQPILSAYLNLFV